MEQGGVSIIPTATIPDQSMGKRKSIGITVHPNTDMQTFKEKLKSTWLGSLMKEEATGWEIFTSGIGEIIGTAILVFIGCTGCIGTLGVVPTALQVSATFGLAAMIAIQCMAHISGAHINPCLTIASLILGKKSLPMTLFYIICQCIGALLGYALLKLITPSSLIYKNEEKDSSDFCVTAINPNLSYLQGFMAEFLGTAILVLFACSVWDCRNLRNTDSTPIKFGLCIAALCVILIPYTGCGLNPARSFAPALWNNYWADQWVFWVAPICGAIVIAIFYRCLFECRASSDETVHT